VDAWLLWFLAAVALLIAEMFTGGFWLACVAVGCAAAGLIGLLPFGGLIAQTISFAAASLLSLAGLRPALNRRFLPSGAMALRTGVEALLGRTGYVTQRIAPGHQAGRVVVEGEDWRAIALDDSIMETGTRVTVIQVEGTTLTVERES
jgi:membrane protein implicated in regulation of membrane protease activity